MHFTEKERSYLQEFKAQEELCVQKYDKASKEACDPELRDLFTAIKKEEQQHLDTVEQLLGGTMPQMTGGRPQGVQVGGQPVRSGMTTTETSGCSAQDVARDKYLASDTLGTEKHASAGYNTGIFEFRDEQVRNIINHLQTEEQEHGKKIYDYMEKHGMYQTAG